MKLETFTPDDVDYWLQRAPTRGWGGPDAAARVAERELLLGSYWHDLAELRQFCGPEGRIDEIPVSEHQIGLLKIPHGPDHIPVGISGNPEARRLIVLVGHPEKLELGTFGETFKARAARVLAAGLPGVCVITPPAQYSYRRQDLGQLGEAVAADADPEGVVLLHPYPWISTPMYEPARAAFETGVQRGRTGADVPVSILGPEELAPYPAAAVKADPERGTGGNQGTFEQRIGELLTRVPEPTLAEVKQVASARLKARQDAAAAAVLGSNPPWVPRGGSARPTRTIR